MEVREDGFGSDRKHNWTAFVRVLNVRDLCDGRGETMRSGYSFHNRRYNAPRTPRGSDSEAQETLKGIGCEMAWTVYKADPDTLAKKPNGELLFEESTLRDIVGKLVLYGSISGPQIEFLKSLVDRLGKRPEKEAERARAADCPTGKTVVTGTILSVKEKESPYGYAWKMTVEATEGYRVWMTVPAELYRGYADPLELKGRTICVSVTLKPSDDDPKFGFGTRPKVEPMSRAQAA